MPKYILVNANEIQEIEAEEMLNLKEIQNLVGVPGEEAFFEPVYQCFSGRSSSCVMMILCGNITNQLVLLQQELFFMDKS